LAKAKERANQPKKKKKFSKMLLRTTKKQKKKITVDSFAFHSPLFSVDSNFADREMIKKFTADRHDTTTKDRTAGAISRGRSSFGGQVHNHPSETDFWL
jgi:hypothetical protein